mmetsp:Transcript_53544/g.122565  ORF Transcript_53544/g.122565 Transcript_53544/m.122565 type:complete len:130 (-) Transcript_53544:85-474(-)
MARRYDSRTTTFSPEGRLYQVEYAMEAINNAGSTIGILSKDGVILAGEKKTTSKLLDQGRSSEKIYAVDDHGSQCLPSGTSPSSRLSWRGDTIRGPQPSPPRVGCIRWSMPWRPLTMLDRPLGFCQRTV